MKLARVLALSGALTALGAVGIAATQNAAPAKPPAGAPTAPTAATTPAAPAPAGAFRVDNTHSSVIFRIKHSEVSNFYGRFNSLSGAWNLEGLSAAAGWGITAED